MATDGPQMAGAARSQPGRSNALTDTLAPASAVDHASPMLPRASRRIPGWLRLIAALWAIMLLLLAFQQASLMVFSLFVS